MTAGVLWATQLAGNADGYQVVGNLGKARDVVGELTGSVQKEGAYGKNEPNASSVPFLGADPGSLVAGLFDGLDALKGLDFRPADGANVRVITEKLREVSAGLSPGSLTGVLSCGSSVCADDAKVESVTSIALRLLASGTKPAKVMR